MFTLSVGSPRAPPGITWGQGADRNVLAHPAALALPLCPCAGGPRDKELFQVSYLGVSSLLQSSRHSELLHDLHSDQGLRDGAASGPLMPLCSHRLWSFLWSSLRLLSRCEWPEGEGLSLGLRGPGHQNGPFLPFPAAVLEADVGVSSEGPEQGGSE